MAIQVNKPTIDDGGRFIDNGSGIIVPRTYQHAQITASMQSVMVEGGITAQGFNKGLALTRDGQTLTVKFPAKGGGDDDRIAAAIVDGNIANVGVSPVLSPQISGIVRHQMQQAVTTSIELTGRRTPKNKAHDAIARFNDSPLGITSALEQITYGLNTYNRGAPVATVPITYDFSQWDANGLNAVPILGKDEKKEDATRFYLDVDWGKVGMPVPYLPSIYDLEPTGVAEWPYWYRAYKWEGDSKKSVWVLLHSSHIIPMTPGVSSIPGIGTSSVWICLGFLAESILISDERIEKMLYALTEGILLLGGVNMDPDKIKKQIQQTNAEAREEGFAVAKGVTVISSLMNNVSSAYISFRQPSGIPFKDWREYCEDITALSFGETLSAVVVRGGVGFGVQAETASDNSAEAGVGAHLHRLAITLGAMYPRVMVSVNRPNDRTKRINIAMLGELTTATTQLVSEGVITPRQVELLIEREVFTIPEDDGKSTTSSANTDDNEDDTDQTEDAPAEETSDEADGEDLDAQLDRALELAVLYDDPKNEESDIDDDDVDTAVERARERVDDDLGDLLEAESVDDEDDE